MITVKIASELTSEGVSGVRWVLVDADEPGAPGPTPASVLAEAAVSAASLPGSNPRAQLSLWLVKGVVLLLGLAGAWWAGQVVLGAPKALSAARPASVPAAATQPAHSQPLPLPPAQPASIPVVTAEAR